MKKKFSIVFTGALIALVITVKGQYTLGEVSQKRIPRYFKSLEKKTDDLTCTNLNMHAIRHFTINYAEVSNENWYCTPAMVVAMFTLNGIDYRVDYDKVGNWIETFRTYDETKLSSDMRETVKDSYAGYNISMVQELEQPMLPIAYIIHLEGKTKLVSLMICDGIMQERQKFNKSK
jgi:hypothetical protein